MRFLVVLIALASACDLKPPPKQAPSAATPQATPPVTPPVDDPAASANVPVDAGAAPPVAVADAATAPVDAMEVSNQCVNLGVHVADVMIAEATEPSKNAALTQDRARIVRRTAEGCTRDKWNDELIACFMAGKTTAAMQACRKPAPPSPPPADERPR